MHSKHIHTARPLKQFEDTDKIRRDLREDERYDVMCSAPAVVYFGGDIGSAVGETRVVAQVVPRRVYVRLTAAKGPKTRFDVDYFYWDSPSTTYKTAAPRIADRSLFKVAAKHGFVGPVLVSVFSDYPQDWGGAWAGAFSAALTGALMIRQNGLTQEDIEEWQGLGNEDLFRLNDQFKRCLDVAKDFENAIHGPVAYPHAGSFFSILGGRYPIWFRNEEFVTAMTSSKTGSLLETWPGRLVQPLEVPKTPGPAISGPLPVFEIALVSSGVGRNPEGLSHNVRKRQEGNRQLLSDIADRTFRALRSILPPDPEENAILDLVREMNLARALFDFTGLGWPQAAPVLASWFDTASRLQVCDEVGLKPTGAGAGGFLLSIAKATGPFHLTLQESLTAIQPSPSGLRPEVFWIDTIPLSEEESCGLKVDSVRSTAGFGGNSRKGSTHASLAPTDGPEQPMASSVGPAHTDPGATLPQQVIEHSGLESASKRLRNRTPKQLDLANKRQKMLAEARGTWREVNSEHVPKTWIRYKASRVVDANKGLNRIEESSVRFSEWFTGLEPEGTSTDKRMRIVLLDPIPPTQPPRKNTYI